MLKRITRVPQLFPVLRETYLIQYIVNHIHLTTVCTDDAIRNTGYSTLIREYFVY